jgi:hypothetical protein
MWRLLYLLAAVAACSFDTSGTPHDDDDDAPPDAPLGCPCAIGCESDGTSCLAFDPSNLDDLSLLTTAAAPLEIETGTWVLDTDVAVLRDDAGTTVTNQPFTVIEGAPGLVVWSIDRLAIAAAGTLRVVGDRALIILSATRITVDGTLDVSAGCNLLAPDRDRLWCGGPGGGDGGHRDSGNGRTDAGGCAPGGSGDAGSTRDEHGGGGGGFGTPGGDGAGVDGTGADSEGGAACGEAGLEPLQGGSGGGVAGYFASGTDDNRTAGGGGGGAVQLTARHAIDVTGTIDASGEGGAGTAQFGTYEPPGGDGGGGGGAGGGILLEAPTVTIAATARLVANGGGGGAGLTIDRRGERGQRVHVRALGGVNDDLSTGGAGAIGDGTDEGATDGADPGDGGSGGGGGAGRIRLRSAELSQPGGAVVSPAATSATLAPL